VDARETNSLHNIIKGERLARENNFRVYYFPEIPLEHSTNKGGIVDKEYSFQRSMANGEFIEEAKETPDEVGQKAYIEGFAKGKKDALESGKRMLEPALNSLREALLELEKVKKDICFNAEKETVELALAIAKKIVGYEVTTKKELVLRVVREALNKVADHDRINIRINPSDFQVCRDVNFQLSELIDNTESITFEEDDKIHKGGCIIETNLGDIDARIEKQLHVIEETFKSELQKNV
jgi:flagellar assembly protein FliH